MAYALGNEWRIKIGDEGDRDWAGRIAGFSFFCRALDGAEVSKLYEATQNP